MTTFESILIAWLAMAMVMASLWLVQRVTRNAGIVDVAWSFGTALSAVWLLLYADGDVTRRWIVGGMVGLWGARLGWHLATRMTREPEDGRYQQMRQRWGDHEQWKLFGFFQIQAAWAVLFAIPMLAAGMNTREPMAWFDVAAIAVWLVSITGTTVSDWQLSRFKSRDNSSGKVCRVGLWQYSRHPNYFFEWVGWWAYLLLAVGSSWWWVAALGPAVMLFFLLKVTGIPPTEARALESRGDAYRDYQRTTSAFFPLPPKQSDHDEQHTTETGVRAS